MFNSPLLDVAIGLVFVFLIYSLLATSILEMIAMVFGLRARMLKTAIVERMLSQTANDNRWLSFWKGVVEFFRQIVEFFTGRHQKAEAETNLGGSFFEHPVIRKYGSSRIFHLPSYIPAHNFSDVLTDVLKQEFTRRMDEIANYKASLHPSNTLESIRQNLSGSTDMTKLREIIEYYGRHYRVSTLPPQKSIIDRETWKLLHLHLEESANSIEQFTRNLETWFDDMMNRVSGWYKRQTQVLLFILGVLLAILFNVDTLIISHRLSVDKDARDKIVALGMQAADKYKDDPGVRKIANQHGEIIPDTSKAGIAHNEKIFNQYKLKYDSIKLLIETDQRNASDILALGWGDYGKKETHLGKIGYVLSETWSGRKLLGFIITAFAICLGAPFWFDLLNKLVRLRAAGKKEGNDQGTPGNSNRNPTPVIVNVNTPRDEAVG